MWGLRALTLHKVENLYIIYSWPFDCIVLPHLRFCILNSTNHRLCNNVVFNSEKKICLYVDPCSLNLCCSRVNCVIHQISFLANKSKSPMIWSASVYIQEQLLTFFFQSNDFFLSQALLRYNWHTTLCKFNIYNLMIWQTCMLQNYYHIKVS